MIDQDEAAMSEGDGGEETVRDSKRSWASEEGGKLGLGLGIRVRVRVRQQGLHQVLVQSIPASNGLTGPGVQA